MIEQPNLFEAASNAPDIEKVLLFALGEFQSRGKILAERELALDRLRGAFSRAADRFGGQDLTDEELIENLERLGARVKRLPPFRAKHPFHVTIPAGLAESAESFYRQILNDE
ncbi:MAG: hypothetical protein ACR2N3_07165 [Pyrinomonadaceae bacterium]